MKTIVELDQKDVIKILSKYLKVDPDCVSIDCRKTWVGQGLMEHEIAEVKVTINAKSCYINDVL